MWQKLSSQNLCNPAAALAAIEGLSTDAVLFKFKWFWAAINCAALSGMNKKYDHQRLFSTYSALSFTN